MSTYPILDNKTEAAIRSISVSEAIKWTIFWIFLALCFYGYLWLYYGKEWANLYLAGYALEKSLSIDNLIVFMAIFSSFGVEGRLQRYILYWGILGALIFRGIFVVLGTAFFQMSPWVGFLFAFIVAWGGIKMLSAGRSGESESTGHTGDYTSHWSVQLAKRLLPVCTKLCQHKFFLRHTEIIEKQLSQFVTREGKFYATPVFLCLLTIETSDIIFSFDSVPAVISVTQEPLLVYAAMIFAILGLRSLYFVLAELTKRLVHLEKAVIVLLFFIAGKMALHAWEQVFGETGIHISSLQNLGVVLGVLTLGVLASWVFPEQSSVSTPSQD